MSTWPLDTLGAVVDFEVHRVVHGKPGSKAKRAAELGVRVMLEPEFLELVGRKSG